MAVMEPEMTEAERSLISPGFGDRSDDAVVRAWGHYLLGSSRGVAIVDAGTGTIDMVNDAFARIHGGEPADFNGARIDDLVTADSTAAIASLLDELRRTGYAGAELEHVRRDGAFVSVYSEVAADIDENGNFEKLIFMVQDISERKRIEDNLVKLADTDTVTGLWNRRRFEDELTRQVSRCRRYHEEAGLLLVDLDVFKTVNDTYGHRSGDGVLKAIGDTLIARLRESDGAARIGGDEFAVLLPNVSVSQATLIGDSLRREISGLEFELAGDQVKVTASVGVIHIDSESGSDEEIMVAVDRALYRAKRAGRDRTAVAEPAETVD